MKFSSSATCILHPTFLSCHPDDNKFPVDFIPLSFMDSSYSQDDGADNLPPVSIVAAAVAILLIAMTAMTKKLCLLIVILDSLATL